MPTIPTAIRFVRLSLAASLLGGGLLIGSVQATPAAEITPTPFSSPVSQAQDAGQAEPETTPAPAKPVQFTPPPVGVVGFGWG